MNANSRNVRQHLLALAAIGMAVLVTSVIPSARADVVTASESGFTTRNIAVIAASPTDVYRALVRDVARWWDPAHTYSKDAANLSIDGRAGGLFLERLPGGGSVAHMTVVYAEPGKALRLLGGMGPLQASAVIGSMTWALTPEGQGTKVELTYVVGGYRENGLKEMGTIVDRVVGAQLLRLKAFVEKRKMPDAPAR